MNPLGMESGTISNTQITSSSGSSTAINTRLDTNSAWIAGVSDKNQWVEVNLYRQMVITGVIMQGNPSSDKWVTRYKVEFSLDHAMWKNVTDEYGITEVSLKIAIFPSLMYDNNFNYY